MLWYFIGMQIEITKKPKSVVFIKGSLPAEDFDAHIKHVTDQFVSEAELPGFRKGKAPEKMVVEKISEAALLEEAAEEALKKEYPAILKEHAIDAIGQPQIRITKLARGNALEFEAEISVLPAVPVPDYKKLTKIINEKPAEDINVSDEEIQKSIEWLQKSRRPLNQSSDKTEHDSGLALTDEFAQSLGNFKTVADLKTAIRENMLFEKKEKAREKRRMELLNGIAEKTTVEIPDILIDAEKQKMLAEIKSGVTSMGMEWAAYLDHIKKTEDDLVKDLQKDAERRAHHSLVLREIAEQEHIDPTTDECNAWAYQYLMARPEHEKKDIDPQRVAEYAYGVIRNQKVFEFLESIK